MHWRCLRAGCGPSAAAGSNCAGLAFIAGTVLFCGAIYALALGGLHLAMLAPIGGTLLMLGWALLAASAVWPRASRARRRSKSLWHRPRAVQRSAIRSNGGLWGMNIRMAGLAALACCVVGVAAARADIDVIAVRKAGLDLQASTLGAVNLAFKAGAEAKSFAGAGSAISAWAKQIPSLFRRAATRAPPKRCPRSGRTTRAS